jgi:hypothetical protein
MGRLLMTTPTRRRSTPAAQLLALAAALLMALTAACSSPGEFTQEETVDAQAKLASRPTSEEMVTRYDQMQQRIRDRIDAELGPHTWFQANDGAESTCGFDFPTSLGGRTVHLPLWGFEGNIPDQDWPRARQLVADIAAKYGFASAGAQIDTPGRHDAGGIDTTLGAYYRFGTAVNTSIQVTTGCHLPAEAANAG